MKVSELKAKLEGVDEEMEVVVGMTMKQGELMDPAGSAGVLEYEEEDDTPKFLFVIDSYIPKEEPGSRERAMPESITEG